MPLLARRNSTTGVKKAVAKEYRRLLISSFKILQRIIVLEWASRIVLGLASLPVDAAT